MSKTTPKKDRESNRLTGRLSRYARVTTSVGGLAARVAGEKYLGLKMDRGKHASDLRLALGGLKGPLMKVAQMLATIPDAVPKEYAAELAQLQADAPPMGWPFVKRRMAAELGLDWEKKFRSFSRESAAAASLGQVHKAETLKGEQVACKLQYPDMASAVEADLKQLKLIFALFERVDPAFRTKQIHAEITDRLREELDYGREAQALSLFASMLEGEEGVHVPKLHPKLSTSRLLTMEWVDGQRLMTFRDAPQKTRNALALNMFRAWYIPFYHYGVIHGDPHPGNYLVGKDNTINLLDFGCVRIFPPKFVAGVIALYRALEKDDAEEITEAFRNWGFKDLKKEVIDILTIWAKFVYGPVLENRKRLIDETESGLYGRATARKVHFALRDVGGVEVPREFVFMDRAAIGLGSVFFHLKAEINWYRLFNDLIADFDEKALARRQREILKRFGFQVSG
jgi:predicted unusual protein kinase regulating ubiquinone biosynthesis (AarF/ABC1/UbiB family)